MYKKSKYTFLGFRESNSYNKKYDAIIKNKNTNKIVSIPFGDKRYEQYKDSTPLKLYKKLNHMDKKRRDAYRKRFTHLYNPKYYSSTYFSWNYLW